MYTFLSLTLYTKIVFVFSIGWQTYFVSKTYMFESFKILVVVIFFVESFTLIFDVLAKYGALLVLAKLFSIFILSSSERKWLNIFLEER